MINQLPYSLKYEATLDYPISMYDNLPYERNSDFCNAEHIGLTCGKIVKYYLCLNHQEEFQVNNHDDEIQEILAKIRLQEQERLHALEMAKDTKTSTDGITEEQIQTLLEDQSEQSDNTASASPDEIADPETDSESNPFADVEDW